jgi:hypothetical protein
MRVGTRERVINIMAGAGVAAVMFSSWLDPGFCADRGNRPNGGPRWCSFAI